MEPLIILLAIGAIGGIIRTYLGYETQSDADEGFNYGKAAKSIVRAAVIGASLVMGITVATNGEITNQTYIMAFFLSVGADVMAKEGYGTVKP